jgi:DNA repair protein RecN (Recombination protein N)
MINAEFFSLTPFVKSSLICHMLSQLHIINYAIIDDLLVEFSPGLNVITGETGAGKSILMGALSLILGDRADGSALMNREKKCIVEGFFRGEFERNEGFKNYMANHDLDLGDELLIRREVGSNGKSRAFVNDTPVNLQQLRELCAMLVDLHRQFDTLELGESDFQREVLDALAGNGPLLDNYRELFRKWLQCKKDLGDLIRRKDQFIREFDYNKFLFDELEELSLKPDELEEMDQELKLLSSSEDIQQVMTKVSFELDESERPMVQELKSLANQLGVYSAFHKSLPDIIRRLLSAQIELQDIASEIEGLKDSIQYDPQRMEEIQDRMAKGYRLLKKHGVKTTKDLLQIQSSLKEKLQAVLNLDEELADKEKEVAAQERGVSDMAVRISAERRKHHKNLEEKVNQLLSRVGMPNARLKVRIENAALNADGMDAVDFLFDGNKSNRFDPLRKVASGGELSRLMLCIKSLVAESMDMATLIFDEIDTGISGEAAKQVGMIMQGLALKRQLVCITHQPQIAGRADRHLFVYKEGRQGVVNTRLKLLSETERIQTIAQMLGGERPTAAALANAKEMILIDGKK